MSDDLDKWVESIQEHAQPIKIFVKSITHFCDNRFIEEEYGYDLKNKKLQQQQQQNKMYKEDSPVFVNLNVKFSKGNLRIIVDVKGQGMPFLVRK